MQKLVLALAIVLSTTPCVLADDASAAGAAPTKRAASVAEPSPAPPLDPCPTGMPYEVVYTVAAPAGVVRAPEPLTFVELLPNRTDALARRRAVATDGLDLPLNPSTGGEMFYPAGRILAIELRPIC